MIKPKIVLLIDWYLPGTKAGGPVRSVYSLVNLLKTYFEFYIITSNCDLGDQKSYDEIKPNIILEKEGVKYLYLDKSHFINDFIYKKIKEINPDLLYLNSFWSIHLSILIVRLKNKNKLKCHVLLAPRGMLGKGARSLKSFKKNLYILIAKFFGWYNTILFHATQAQEKSDIQSVFPKAVVKVAPNINSLSAVNNVSVKNKNQLKLFYLSRVARVKNLHLAIKSLANMPTNFDIEYDVYGNLEDKAYWQECESLISALPPNVKVKYNGELAFNKIQDTIVQYHCLLLPTLNENFGHSIVESLLCGCPAIISDQTPWNDLEPAHAGFAISLNNQKGFEKAIEYYANLNQEEFLKASLAAQHYIASKINIQQTVELYKNLFNDCIKN